MGFVSEQLIGVLAMAGALVSLWFARRMGPKLGTTLRRLVALRRGRSQEHLAERPVGAYLGLRGRVVAIDRIRSPHTDRDAVYIECIEEVWDNTPNVIGAAGKWVAAAHSEEAAPFELTDGERSILVDPSGAEVLAPVTRGGEPQRGMRFTEEVIEPDTEVIVLGHLTEQGGFTPEGGYRGSPFRRVMALGRRGLLIATPGQLYKRIASRLGLRGGLLLGALVLAVVTLLVTTNAFPVVRLELPGEVVMTNDLPEIYENDSSWNGPCRENVGPARAEVWTLGWIVGALPEQILERRLDHSLWKRQLNWVSEERRSRRRAYLVFDVLTIEGTAHRRSGFWRTYCKLHPQHCAAKR